MKRVKYFIITVLVMFLGLMSRSFSNYLPNIVALYIGDILWATMVYFGIRFLIPALNYRYSFIGAIIFSYGIEISQLYHDKWIDNIRSTTLGGLILGYGFLWSDLVCYTLGIFLGILIDKIFFKRSMENE